MSSPVEPDEPLRVDELIEVEEESLRTESPAEDVVETCARFDIPDYLPAAEYDENDYTQTYHKQPIFCDTIISASDNTHTDTIINIIGDAEKCFKNGREIYETYFYKLVLGGHVKTLERVINEMEISRKDVLAWLLQNNESNVRNFAGKIDAIQRLYMTKAFVFILTIVVNVFLSPVFYIFHGITCNIFKQTSRKFVQKIRLPLVFGALSQSKSVYMLLIKKIANFEMRDKHGNNIFHYIADFSADSTEGACKAFDLVLDCISFECNLGQMLFYEKNSQGLSPLELTAAFGSPVLLTKMMESKSLLINTRFTVMEDGVFLAKEDGELNDEDHQNMLNITENKTYLNKASAKTEYIDVSLYESTNLDKRSFLLRLICGRNLTTFNIDDFALFKRCPFIGKWISLKVNEMSKYIYSFQALDVFVSLIMILLLVFRRQVVTLNQQIAVDKIAVQVEEIHARQTNESSILINGAFQQSFQREIADVQMHWVVKILNKDEIRNLMGIQTQNTSIYSVNELLTTLSINQKAHLFHRAAQKAKNTSELLVLQNLDFLVQKYSKTLFKTNPDILLKDYTEKIHDIEVLLEQFYASFTVQRYEVNLHPALYIKYTNWQNLFCLKFDNLTKSDLKIMPNAQPSTMNIHDICTWQSLIKMAELSCDPSTPNEVYEMWDNIMMTYDQFDSTVEVLVWILTVIAVLYIAIDIYEKLEFHYLCISHCLTIQKMFLSVLSKRVPGSYYKKQLNITTFYILILHTLSRSEIISFGSSTILLEKYTHHLLLTALLLRFILHIHALRLVPSIGHFIIATFMMATNLIHFSIILGIVVFGFSLIFHLLLFDLKCPVRQHEGYTNFWQSLLSIFMLTFGHGDFDQYRLSLPVITSYVLFVIICALLLLNLIIAIMTTTATNIMTPEGKQTLKMTEWLYEALAAEFTVTALARTCISRLLYDDHMKAGYVVEGSGRKRKVYIRAFYCSKLD